jgi:DHA2 family multidrug resistance protein-like MFS transporter
MAALMMSIALAILDTAIVNTALPSIARSLNADPAPSIWIINSYQLAAVATLLPFAALGAIIGHRNVYIGGLVLFTIASAACSLSVNLVELTAARVLQGIGASAVMSVNTALIVMLYPKSILGRGLGLNALVVGVAFALGPTAASSILSFGNWQWLFAVNVPIGAGATIFSFLYLPHSSKTTGKFDIPGALMTAIAFAALVYALGALAQGEVILYPVAALTLFTICVAVLAVHERGNPAPMLPLDILRRPIFALSAFTGFCAFLAQGVAFVALPFYFEHMLGISAKQTGFIMAPWSAVVAMMAPLAGRLSDRHSPGILGATGLLGLAVGMSLFAFIPASAPIASLVGCMILSGIGFGLFQSPNQKAIMSSAPSNRSSGASGVVATSRLVGQATGASLVALSLGMAEPNGPVIALLFGAGVALIGCVSSLIRLAVR